MTSRPLDHFFWPQAAHDRLAAAWTAGEHADAIAAAISTIMGREITADAIRAMAGRRGLHRPPGYMRQLARARAEAALAAMEPVPEPIPAPPAPKPPAPRRSGPFSMLAMRIPDPFRQIREDQIARSGRGRRL